MTVVLYKTAERPSIALWWRDSAKNLIDFSAGYTFVFKIGNPGTAALFTKSSGITGAAGAGAEPDGTPNVVIAFTAAELDTLTAFNSRPFQVFATTGGLSRVFEGSCQLRDVIT
jgi:hypothetical protein